MNIIICGAALDTLNLGVSALCHATIYNLNERFQGDANFFVADNGLGVREATLNANGKTINIKLVGLRAGKKFWRPENELNIRLMRFLPFSSPVSRVINSIDYALDISGGDSFTDLYGEKRYHLVTFTKHLFKDLGVSQIFLPQTYGPFKSSYIKQDASNLVNSVEQAWARDLRSFEILKELSTKNTKIDSGVDVAFLLPREPISVGIKDFTNTIGINVNGLIYNNIAASKSKYKFIIDYKQTLIDVITRFVTDYRKKVVLIPHVLSPLGHYESDYEASNDLKNSLSKSCQENVQILEPDYSECEIKNVISQVEWFMGTRMHSTIAALSTCTPLCTISYSDKAKGVFETCGVGRYVLDPRELEQEKLIEELFACFDSRLDCKSTLDKQVPLVIKRANAQFDSIYSALTSRE